MYIHESEISCGIQELAGIGQHPTLQEYKQALRDGHEDNSHKGLGCFLIASVPYRWKNSIKFLESVGFKNNGVRKNPNSENKIVLFSKTITAKERQSLGRRCIDCGSFVDAGLRRRRCTFCGDY